MSYPNILSFQITAIVIFTRIEKIILNYFYNFVLIKEKQKRLTILIYNSRSTSTNTKRTPLEISIRAFERYL